MDSKLVHIISRDDAKERGMKRYFTGKPCKHGHISERRVSNKRCITCDEEYHPNYYRENLDYYQSIRDRSKEETSEYDKMYYKKNKERKQKQSKEYYESNRNRMNEKKRILY